MKRPWLIMTLLAAAFCLSCIKEDRSGCPCLLRMEFVDSDGKLPEGVLIVSIAGESYSRMETVDPSALEDPLEFEVPRTGVRVNVWSEDAAPMVVDGDGLVIPFGDDCPPVRMNSLLVDTDCECRSEKLAVLKNYCHLTVVMEDADAGYPYDLSVSGNVDGYGLDGLPRHGRFCHYLPPSASTSSGSGEQLTRDIFLPRQSDSSLMLEISENASVLKTFAIGNYIAQSGYDWTREELEDIVVRIDYACTRLEITVGDWKNSYDVDIEF